MYFMSLKYDDIFYMRLLLANRKKVTSFDDFRIIEVQMKNAEKSITMFQLQLSFKQACNLLDLIENDDEWHATLNEIIDFDTTIMLRDLLMTILLECDSANSETL